MSQDVWPGDVNNNGVVNGVDLLYWGRAFGATGAARSTESTDWSAQTGPTPWAQRFPSGLNYAFADCDGNGKVDDEDFDGAIEDNFGLEHGLLQGDGYLNAAPGNGPKLRMEASATLVEPGMTIDIDLFLDENGQQATNFYGLAMKMSYSTGLLQGNDGPDFDFTESSWLEAGDDNAQGLFVDNGGNGKAELAFSRTNQTTVAIGTEAIGQFHVIVEDIIIGLVVDTIVITIDSVLLVDAGLTGVAVVPDTLQIVVAKDTAKYTQQTTRTRTPGQLAQEIAVHPNPVRSSFAISSPYRIGQLWLVDAMGKQWNLPVDGVGGDRQRVALPPGLPPGLYCLRIRTSHGECSKKMIVWR